MRCIAFVFAGIFLLGCGEWVDSPVGKVSCSFGSFNDFLPSSGRPLKMVSGNNGNNIYILDDFHYVHSYKRDDLYECAFELEETYGLSGIPKDILFANGGFYVQDGARLISENNTEECYARDGFFAVYGNELAVGSSAGIDVWNIRPSCTRKESVSSQKVLALAATNIGYYAVEGIATEPQNLAVFYKHNSSVDRLPFSAILGNDNNFRSASRVIWSNGYLYLLDKDSRKIGVFDVQSLFPTFQKSISLDSIGIRTPLDIAAAEFPYIFILHGSGVVKVNGF